MCPGGQALFHAPPWPCLSNELTLSHLRCKNCYDDSHQGYVSRRHNRLSESIKRTRANTSNRKAFFRRGRSLFVSPLTSVPLPLEFDESAGNDYRERGTEKRSTRTDPRCFSHRRSFFLSLVIIITDARVHASAMERVDRRTTRRRRRRRRRRMWSSRRVWSDVCPVYGGMRKTGSLYVLHARRLPKPSPSLRAAVYVPACAYTRPYTCVCHGDTNVSAAVSKARRVTTFDVTTRHPATNLFFPFPLTLGSRLGERALITPRDACRDGVKSQGDINESTTGSSIGPLVHADGTCVLHYK